MRLALVAVGATAAGFTAGALLTAGGGALRAAALLGLIRRLRALLGRGVRIALLLRGCGRDEHAALLLRGLLARILLRGTRIGALLRCARLLLLSLPALSGWFAADVVANVAMLFGAKVYADKMSLA